MKRILTAASICVILITSCIKQLDDAPQTSSYCPKVEVSLAFSDSPITKSEIESMLSSDRLHNFNLFVYDANGMLFEKRYYDNAENAIVKLELYNNAEYHVYAVGNLGVFPTSYKEEQLKSYIYHIKSSSDIIRSGSLPMTGFSKINTSENTSFSVNMERIASIVDLRLKCPDGLNIEISEVAILSTPDAMALFENDLYSKNRLPGDKLNKSECKRLENGETISLYSLENLESPNEVLSNSVIDNIQDIPEGCPYISIKGKITNSAGLTTAEIDYRIALNYKLRRNKRYLLTVSLTQNGVFEDSYKINVTNAAFDFAVTRLSVPVGQKKLLYCPISKYIPVEYSSFDYGKVWVYKNGYVEGLREGRATVTARCPSLGIERVCEVDVTPADSLTPNIENYDMMAGQQYKMHFYAPLGGYLKFWLTSPLDVEHTDSLILDLVHDRGIITLENDLVKIVYDPKTVGTEQDEFVTFISKDEVMVDYELGMPDDQYAYNHNEMYSAFLSYNLSKSYINENEKLHFELYLSDYHKRLSPADFASMEIYNRLYKEFGISIPPEYQDVVRIESFDPKTGKGTIVPISAKGNKNGITVDLDVFVTGTKNQSSRNLLRFKVYPA